MGSAERPERQEDRGVGRTFAVFEPHPGIGDGVGHGLSSSHQRCSQKKEDGFLSTRGASDPRRRGQEGRVWMVWAATGGCCQDRARVFEEDSGPGGVRRRVEVPQGSEGGGSHCHIKQM